MLPAVGPPARKAPGTRTAWCASLSLVACAVVLVACADSPSDVSGGRDASRDITQPVGPSGGVPPPLPSERPPDLPTPAITAPDRAASRDRQASFTVAAVAGERMVLDVAVGGPPCDVVSAVMVDERNDVVAISVWAGAQAGAECGPGAIARLGTVRVEVLLDAPLGDRTVIGRNASEAG